MDKKILIIDDDPQDLKGMAMVLEKAGFGQVRLSQTMEEGIGLVRSFRPDVVIIDVVLTGPDGFDACKTIKGIPGMTPKILIITGHLDAIDADKARASGADEIIEKVPQFANLGDAVRLFCQN